MKSSIALVTLSITYRIGGVWCGRVRVGGRKVANPVRCWFVALRIYGEWFPPFTRRNNIQYLHSCRNEASNYPLG